MRRRSRPSLSSAAWARPSSMTSAGQFDALAQGLDLLAHQEGGGGVQQHDVAVGAGRAGQQVAQGLGVLGRRAAGQVGQRGALQAHGLGRDR